MAGPHYAVILKVHYWDGFADRQLQRLRRRAGTDHLFVVADETKGPIANINHDQVIRITEDTARDEGLLIHPQGNAFWYNRDYPLHHFTTLHPGYEYIVIVEHDCVVTTDIAPIIATMADERLGFVGEPVRDPPDSWFWRPFTAAFYPPEIAITGRLLNFAAFSRDFALDLKTARLEHTGRCRINGVTAGPIYQFAWPNAEGLVGAEIARRGIREKPLSAFADTSCYGPAPARPEPLLARLPAGAFLHPILDTPRFLAALPKYGGKVEDIFDPASFTAQLAQYCPAEPFLHEILHHFVRQRDLPNIERLREHAARLGANDAAIFNVARGKPATQSSISEHSSGDCAADAGGAVNGRITGGHGFHTGFEENPWWCVDLGTAYPVSEIRLYNRLELAERARSIVVLSSLDLTTWTILHDHGPEGETFGGADGRPLRIEFPTPVAIRHLRLHLPGKTYLHLDEVEIHV